MTATWEQTTGHLVDLDWGPWDEWNPALHPRDRRGRFTKSRTVELTDEDKAAGNEIISNFRPKKFASDQEATDYLNSGPALPEDQSNAVDRYTGDAFLEINRALRAGKDIDESTTIDNLRAAMHPTEDDLILTRTVSLDAFGSVPIEDLAGKKVKDAGFSSVSLGLAYGGSLGNVQMKIAVPKGTPAVFAARYSRNPDEREIVLPDGLNFAVASVKKNDKFGYDMTLIVLPPDPPPEQVPVPPAPGATMSRRPIVAGWPPPWAAADDDGPGAPDVDLSELQQQWEDALAQLLAAWGPILDEQYTDLARQIAEAIDAGDLGRLSTLTAPDAGATETLTDVMVELATLAAEGAAAEAVAQGALEVVAAHPVRDTLVVLAAVAAGILGTGVVLSAAREALRVHWPGAPGADVAARVREHLDALTDAQPRLQLGGALSEAQHHGRIATMRAAPVTAYYGNETLDANTCGPCREINGRWLGNSIDDAVAEYPAGTYIRCEGGLRCRGQVVAVYRGGDDRSKWQEKEPEKT
jgi:hypothetical protein